MFFPFLFIVRIISVRLKDFGSSRFHLRNIENLRTLRKHQELFYFTK